MATRAQRVEGLLGDGVCVLEVLMESPDRMLDELERATRDTIEVARETLRAADAAIA
jgi:hypothetical protein